MDDLDTIQLLIAGQVKGVVEKVKLAKSQLMESVLDDYVRDSSGRKIAPSRLYKQFDSVLVAHDDHLDNVPTKITAQKIKPPAHSVKPAQNHILELRKKALVLIGRAEKGTFPYSDNGDWLIS